ncbi:MAG: gliding motility-associated C-terminal domain-containing protein [Bacteroidales bacterium]|nr:gliding motility-associated C-terminal domain-containing protein [Bacteroidales bacterium]
MLVLIVMSLFAQAQKQTSVWYFGDNAGLDFKSGSPLALTDGALATREGCASICDKNGDILFYTEGTKVWNKNHQIMENGTGLLGDFTSTQSAIIVPKPGSDKLYYVFTVQSLYEESGQLHYSVIDVPQNGGLGKVIEKNVLLYQPIVEKITAVQHANGIDYWVITHERYTNTFVVYLVSNAGVSDTPVFSSVGVVHSEPFSNWGGYLRASPGGKYLAYANQYPQSLFELLDFDTNTGTASNPITFYGYLHSYGVEFSPDESKLYLAKIKIPPRIYQIDLNAGSPEDIINSSVLITETTNMIGALQAGPDKRIYVALDYSNYLGVINEPNLLGDSCDFVLDGVYLKGRQSRLGLPNFVTNFFEADFTYRPDCYGDTTRFTLDYSGVMDSLRWDFGDPASGEGNTSIQQNPFHVFSAPGTFLVQVIVYSGGSTYPIEKDVVIFLAPFVDLGPDTSLCSQSGLLLRAGGGYDSYLWQDGSTDSVFLVSQTGDYWVQVANSCGTASDSIRVDFSESFDIDLGPDTSFCYGHTVLLSPGGGYYAYYWQDGSTDSVYLAGLTGYYWVQVTDSAGCTAIDSVYIEAFLDFGFSIGPDTSVICDGDYLFLHGPEGYENYLWQDGSGYPDFVADTAGIYWLEITDENGCAARDSMLLIVNKIPDDFLGNDTVMCEDDYFPIHAPPYYDKYLWQDGSADPVFIAWETGSYWVYVEDSIGCSGTDTLKLSLFEAPSLNQPDTVICPNSSILLSPGPGWDYYKWSTGSTDPAILVNKEGIYWVETGTPCGPFTDSVFIDLYKNPAFTLGPDTNICENETIKLTPGPGFLSYLWNDGTTDSVLIAEAEGNYWLTVNDGRCLLGDTILVDKCSLLWIPNVFTPNGDGVNDTFYAVGKGVTEFNLVIFNRWGEVMKTLHSIEESWDGTTNGKQCSDGVYYYVATFRESDRNAVAVTKQINGAVTLISGR